MIEVHMIQCYTYTYIVSTLYRIHYILWSLSHKETTVLLVTYTYDISLQRLEGSPKVNIDFCVCNLQHPSRVLILFTLIELFDGVQARACLCRVCQSSILKTLCSLALAFLSFL